MHSTITVEDSRTARAVAHRFLRVFVIAGLAVSFRPSASCEVL